MKSPPLIPPEDWERADRHAMYEFANQLGREGKLPADYGRRKSLLSGSVQPSTDEEWKWLEAELEKIRQGTG